MCDECTEVAWEMSAEDERERIIKLLEEAAPKSWHDTTDQQRMFGWLDAIALIKGENNE